MVTAALFSFFASAFAVGTAFTVFAVTALTVLASALTVCTSLTAFITVVTAALFSFFASALAVSTAFGACFAAVFVLVSFRSVKFRN